MKISPFRALVLRTKSWKPIRFSFLLWMRFSISIFIWLARSVRDNQGERIVESVYLRRSFSWGESEPGLSDIDFFLVIKPLPSQSEMKFLKTFWGLYQKWKAVFPFWGEVLMGDSDDLQDWESCGHIKSLEVIHQWKLVHGGEARGFGAPLSVDRNTVFSEAMQQYWNYLQPVIKLNPKEEKASSFLARMHWRNSLKAAIDLLRIHYGITQKKFPRDDYWSLGREKLIPLLSHHYSIYLSKDVLRLNPNSSSSTSYLLPLLIQCLQDLIPPLEEQGATQDEESESPSPVADPYSLAVREIFCERILLRHKQVARIVMAKQTSHIYVVLEGTLSGTQYGELLQDLCDANFSFDQFSVAMPLSEPIFKALGWIPLFESPFHTLQGYQELFRGENNRISTSEFRLQTHLTLRNLRHCLRELNFRMRLLPREDKEFLERDIFLLSNLLLFRKEGKLYPNLPSAQKALAHHSPIFHENTLSQLKLREELAIRLSEKNEGSPHSKALSDIWIELSPQLRSQINLLQEDYLEKRGRMFL